MAAVSALANLVHCPATPVSSRHLRFPLCKALLGPDAEADPQQAAVLSSLHKVSAMMILSSHACTLTSSCGSSLQNNYVFALLAMHMAVSIRQCC